MPPTNKDVARRAGVSIATVSRVVNGLPNVRPGLRRRVLRAIKQLDYQPSRAAQRLRVNRSRVLGLVISDIENPFFTAVVRGIQDVAYQHGYSLVLCNSDEDPAKEKLYIDVMRAEGAAGVIMAMTGQDTAPLRVLLAHRVPVVAIDRPVRDPRVDSVMVDNVQGAVQAVEHLIALGHRRIGMVSMKSIATGRDRRAGFEQAHSRNGLRVNRRLMALGAAKPEGGYACTSELLKRAPRPTALFIDNSMMLIGALGAIRDAGLHIPQDISVVGFDDVPWAGLLQPPLTTVAQPTYEMGRQAVELIMARLAQPEKAAAHVLLKTTLTVRESTGKPAAVETTNNGARLRAPGTIT